ncbi:MAG: GNAT family N-acetyltransferase [Polyangiaceae bacterium]|jgi:RimJ/RimL family protein N-acetyltransferase|nr:GNAT family N-acetyltransferase [Polyangiaceae bacterium]MBK8939245.1 GNAT family N-acetyltransferase [Polyangiaceae bacterium]
MTLKDLPITRAHPARLIRTRYRGEELTLGPTLVTDAEEIADALNASLPELKRFMPFAHVQQTALTQLERLRGAEADYFAGRDLTMGLFRERPSARRELVAMVGLHPRVPLNPRGLELGYWAPTRAAGQGTTTFAAKTAIVYAFDKLGADRVQVMCDEANTRSRRVIEKCGFALEGVLRNLTPEPAPELVANGYVSTGRHPMLALFPDTFAALPWVAEVRAAMRYVNLAGHEV